MQDANSPRRNLPRVLSRAQKDGCRSVSCWFYVFNKIRGDNYADSKIRRLMTVEFTKSSVPVFVGQIAKHIMFVDHDHAKTLDKNEGFWSWELKKLRRIRLLIFKINNLILKPELFVGDDCSETIIACFCARCHCLQHTTKALAVGGMRKQQMSPRAR